MLQPAYSDHQFRAFKNFDQLVQDALVVLGSGLQIFLQYELRFADGLKCQLLISHGFHSCDERPARNSRKKNQDTFWGRSPLFSLKPIKFCFNGAARAHRLSAGGGVP